MCWKSLHVVWNERGLLHRRGSSVLFGFAMIVASTVAPGCALNNGVVPGTITEADARSIHPWGGQFHVRRQTLTDKQSQRINARLGRQATQPGDVVAYYRVSRNTKRMTGETGTVFAERIDGPKGSPRLIVSIRGGVPQRLVIQDDHESQGVGHEFLDQFIGRDLGHSFQVGTDPEAFHRIPTPIVPLAGQVDLSQRIADAVFKTLVVAAVLEVEYFPL